jgi:parallel beta-helix repeat protein
MVLSQRKDGFWGSAMSYRFIVGLLALFSACFFLFMASDTSAVTTVPTKMNFQGRLSDASGNIKPNGTYNMRLKLYTVNSGGSAVWSEDRLVSATQGVQVTNGLFSIQLGSITTLPASLFAAGDLYLEVELPTPASATTSSPVWTEGPMTPRNQLLTSAYAYNSETLDGLDSAAFAQLDQNNTFTGNTVFNGTIQGGSSLTLGTASVAGSLVVSDGSNNTATISVGSLAGNYTYIIPVTTANDTFCLVTLANCGGAGGGDVYLANANTFTNTNTIAKTSATAFRIQSDSGAATLFTADTSTMTVAINGDVSVAAGKSITIVGGNTASRPASPTEGMVYYDTDTDKLEVYSNGKWQADRTEAILVAASNSSQADRDAADYVADGNTGAAADGDQVQINSALTAGSGKKVVLLAGTYVADATILVPNNTTLTGVGQGTVVELADLDATEVLVENSDTTTGAGVVIRDMLLNGRKDLNTASFQSGIYIDGVGGGTGATIRTGATLSGIVAKNFRGSGIDTNDVTNILIKDSTLISNSSSLGLYGSFESSTVTNNFMAENSGGFYIENASSSVFSHNIFRAESGIYADAISNSIFTGNRISDSPTYGVYFQYPTNNTITNNIITNSTTRGIGFADGSDNIVSNNEISDSGGDGIMMLNSPRNILSNNRISNSGNTTTNNAIFLNASDSTTITGNTITDSSATTDNYAINISNSTSDTTYLADNTLGGGSIQDLGTGTIYGGQVDASGNLRLQPAGTVELQKNTNVTGTLQATGNITASSGTVTVGTSSVAGNLVISDGSSNTATIKVGALAGNYDYTIPVTTANDTFCMVTLANCSGVATVGTYSTTNTSATGATISGSTITFQDASASAPGMVGTGTQTFAGNKTFNGTLSVNDVSIAAGKSITIVGGNTASRPASPTEGMVYYDTDTDKLEVYSNGKWQADRTDAILVAASNSSQADKDAADYVADGNTGTAADGDQVQINNALTAASGKKVVLLAGTYIADATILIPNNTTLAGVGNGTIVELADIDATDNLIENSDTTTGTGIVIRDLKLDGRKDLNTAGMQFGISLNGMGAYSSSRVGAKITGIEVTRFRQGGIYLINSSLNTLSGNSAIHNTSEGFILGNGANNNILDENIAVGDTSDAFPIVDYGLNNTISNNLVKAPTGAYAGIYLSGSTGTVVSGNQVEGASNGVLVECSDKVAVTGNTVHGSGYGGGIFIECSTNTIVSGNNIYNTGLATENGGIKITDSDNNSIVGNVITDSSSTSSNYAIHITDSASASNYLANNTLGGGSISDAGTGTIYAGQVDASGNLRLQPAGTVELQKNTNVTGTLQATGNVTASSGTVTIGTTSVAGNLVISDGSSNTATIKVGALAGNYDYTIPVTTANDTFCLVTLANCSGVATVGTYSTTNTAANGATISGSTITFQDASATAPGMVGTGAQTFAGNKTFTGELKVSKSSSSVATALLQVEQTGTGDTTVELKNAAGSSYYLGMDQSAGGLFRIGSSTSARVTNTVGTTTMGGSAIANVNSQIIAKKVTTGPSVSGSLSSIAVYLSAVDATNPGIKVGLYSHDAGNNRPNALLAGLDVSTNATVGWNILPLSTTISASTTYWIASNVQGASTSVDYAYCGGCGGSSASYYPMSFGNTWPSSLGVPNSTGIDEDYSFYMNVASGGVTDTFAGAKLFAIGDTGAVTLQNSANSSTAFQIQNSSGTSLFVADTSSSRIQIGSASGDINGTVLVLDTKTDAGDPTGVAGAMYYNSNAGKFRCYQGAAWTDCIGAGGSSTLQDAYNASSSPALITTTAAKGIQIVAGAAPTTNVFTVSNSGQGVNTNNANGIQVNYAGGTTGSIEGSGIRVDYTPGSGASSTWNGMKIVSGNSSANTINYGLSIVGPGTGSGTDIGLRVASGFDIGLDIASGGLQLSAMNDPATPSAGNLRVYAKTNAGRTMLKVKGPSGIDYSLQPFFGTNKIGMIQPAGGAANCTTAATNAVFGLLPIFLNYNATTANANTCPRPVANTNFFTAMRRSGVTTSTGAGTLAGMRSSGTANLYFRGDASDRGGFYVVGRVGVATHQAGKRMFAGMNTSFAAPTNVEPSSVFNILGIGCDAADTNLQFMHNDASGAATKVDLGANYPCNTSGVDMYEYRLFSAPNGSDVYYSVSRLNTTDFVEGSVNTNIPANTTMLNNQIWISNNATAAAASLDIASFYVETDN